jgi:hypothetical protein
LKKLGNISVDGTKIQANASKHKAVSYEYAKKQLEVLEGEVKELIAKAEEADSKAGRKGKTKMLDEFVENTGYCRKYALHTLANGEKIHVARIDGGRKWTF